MSMAMARYTFDIGAPLNTNRFMADNDIKIYPNPTNGNSKLQISIQGEMLDLQLHTITGEKLAINYDKAAGCVALPSLSSGVYFISVQTKQGVFQKQLMIK
jgi:hypothetical protein